MIDRNNKNQMVVFAFVTGAILIFDILTIIINAFMVPYLDGFGLPDILIYIKTGVFLCIFVIIISWLVSDRVKISKDNLKSIMYVGLVTIIAYFFSLFMYKYILLLDTATIIKEHVLNGNPSLIYDFSVRNFKALTYITKIYGGLNSELVLFAEAMVFQVVCIQFGDVKVEEEPKHVYDAFLFDKILLPVYVAIVISAFLSLNLFVMLYDFYSAIQMAIGLTAFAFAIPGLVTSVRFFNTKDHSITRSEFLGRYQMIRTISTLEIVLFSFIAIFEFMNFFLERTSYRMIPAILALALSIFALIRVNKSIALENK